MKKIVVCCDGTWNKPGIKDRGKPVKTNVQKIYEAISPGTAQTPQLKYYGQGVGTGFTLGDMILGGSTGLGIDANIMNAYKFLMWNYEPGDQIYLFGFSRGAYTVRSLAGFIRNCGRESCCQARRIRASAMLGQWRGRTRLRRRHNVFERSGIRFA